MGIFRTADNIESPERKNSGEENEQQEHAKQVKSAIASYRAIGAVNPAQKTSPVPFIRIFQERNNRHALLNSRPPVNGYVKKPLSA